LSLAGKVSFRDPARARRELDGLARGVAPQFLAVLEARLATSPDPSAALAGLAAFHAAHRQAFESLMISPAGLSCLFAVVSYSRFLTDEIVQHPDWLTALVAEGQLHQAATRETLDEELARAAGGGVPSPLVLAQFRRRQILRVLLRDVLGYATLSEVTGELSLIADVLIEFACRRLRESLAAQFGAPQAAGAECGFAVIALGKHGAAELNYSSDIDLMFLYGANGDTAGGPAGSITNKEFYKHLANQLTALLSTYTAEGLCYRVDLRLRPEGRLGEVCLSLEGMKRYYASRARDWELQMMIKARVAAGNAALGRELLEFVEPLTYSTSLDFGAIETMSATRERLNEKLAARKLKSRAAAIDVKLHRGGIRDIEFLVQCLQRLHGGREPWVRHGGTMLALARLHDKQLLSDAEYGRLASAYQFLRHLEHRLQFDEDRQTHTLPEAPEELDRLARLMPEDRSTPLRNGAWLLSTLQRHFLEVTEVYDRIVHARQAASGAAPAPYPEPAPPGNRVRALDPRTPRLAARLAAASLRWGQRPFEHFLDKIANFPEWREALERDDTLTADVLDIFDHSSYLSEQLLRFPDLLAELDPARLPEAVVDPAALRVSFRRRMFRILADSVCRSRPVFETLEQTSLLADSAIQAAYGAALAHTLAAKSPRTAGYQPAQQLLVIALGRLGMREFDLGSDADLVFVLPDEDAAEHLFWTRVAGRIIDLLTAYTGEGTLFAVDTRLRPAGREGELVQTAGAYLDYFERTAEAWEGITYMKSRAVAGDLAAGTRFLHRLQEVDWKRYGQGGRSRGDLRQMRLRLEKEQGASHPLKAGPGGFYDIDFLLMYLRLKSAGVFYKVLNTPDRIDVLEQDGSLDRSSAGFLRDAAVYFRAVDHGLRVLSGQAEDALPSSPVRLEALTELVLRWTPPHLHGLPLADRLAEIRAQTRLLFDRFFVR
jgi:glutamate-ammonia-ligase adenylyltransferase